MALNTFWIVIIILVVILVIAILLNQPTSRSRFLAFNVGDCTTMGCPTGSYCAPDSKCYPGRLGDPCSPTNKCWDGLYCNNGYCQPTSLQINQVIPPKSSGTTNAAVAANQVLADSIGKNTVGLGGTCRLGMRDCAPGLGCGIDLKCIPVGGSAAGVGGSGVGGSGVGGVGGSGVGGVGGVGGSGLSGVGGVGGVGGRNANTTLTQNTPTQPNSDIAQGPIPRSSSPSPIELLRMTPLNNPIILPATMKPTPVKSNRATPNSSNFSKVTGTQNRSRRTTRRK